MIFRRLAIAVVSISAFLLYPPELGASSHKRTGLAERIPFVFINNHVILRVSINNSRAVPFILDTGQTVTAIDRSLAKSLGLRPTGNSSTYGTAGRVNVERLVSAKMRIGKLTFTLPELQAMDLSEAPPQNGYAIQGLLGSDVIAKFVVEIDYGRKTVTFHDQDSYKKPARSKSLPLTFIMGTPATRACVSRNDRQACGNLILDTGAVVALDVSPRFLAVNGLPTTGNVSGSTSEIGGMEQSVMVRFPSVEIGGFQFANPIGNISFSPGALWLREMNGYLGGEILRRFNVTFDYKRGNVNLEVNRASKEPFEVDMSGMSIVMSGPTFRHYRIYDVDGPAKKAGVQVNDVLVSIDGKLSSQYSWEELRLLFMHDGQKHRLGLKRGRALVEVDLVLQRML